MSEPIETLEDYKSLLRSALKFKKTAEDDIYLMKVSINKMKDEIKVLKDKQKKESHKEDRISDTITLILEIHEMVKDRLYYSLSLSECEKIFLKKIKDKIEDMKL